jgi:hypothetical protein
VLSVAAGSVGVGREAGASGGVSGGEQLAHQADLGLVLEGAVLDVGLDEELAVVLEQAGDLAEQGVADDEALGVSLLPPGVGEMDEERGDRAVGRDPGQGEAGVLAVDPGPLAEAPRLEPIVDEGGPLAADLEADHPHVGAGGEALVEEAAAAGADLDLERPRGRCEQARGGHALAVGEAGGVAVAIEGCHGHVVRLLHRAGRACKHQVLAPRGRSPGLAAARGESGHLRPPSDPCHASAPPVQDHEERDDGRLDRWLSTALPYAPVALATFWLARITSNAILARTTEPAVPLDDAFIHFQYARSLAEGRFFAFLPGDSYTSGATSLLWPAMLAPFYLLGMRGTSIIWAAWGLGWLFLALLAVETKRLARPLVGELPAIGAAAMVLVFGGYTWFAASGMEVSPLAWCLCRTARLAAEWQEQPAGGRTASARGHIIAMAIVGPLLRPEGMVASLTALGALVLFPSGTDATGNHAGGGAPPEAARARLVALAKARLAPLLCLLGPALPPLINKVLTGRFTTTTTQVKWLALNPYHGGAHFWGGVRHNLDIFVKTLLDGHEWSAVFIPPGSLPVAIAAFIAIPVVGLRSRRYGRAALVLLLAIGMAIPATYLSFLWNRLRYLWPFAFAWCIALACLARVIGDLAALIRPRFAAAAGVVAGGFAGMLAHHLSWSIDDVAQSASAIHRQQVLLGRWASEHLPATARIGVNDTGAIAYFSGRRVFDVVGLTTPGEAPYWVAGAGSRYEHYERMHTARPEALPTHFIVYPHWMACEPVLGRELTRATVTDQSILGGTTMIAYEARYDLLHSGDRPDLPPPGRLIDELDVSDLESEAEHGYDGPAGGGSDADNLVHRHETEAGEQVDAGRDRRVFDRFRMVVPGGKPLTLVARWMSTSGAQVSVQAGGSLVEAAFIPATSWTERAIDIPAHRGASPLEIEIVSRDGRVFGSMHYWLYEKTP